MKRPSPMTSLKVYNRRVFIKHDNQTHPIVSGNKWRKLKFNIEQFQGQGIVSFGGAFSNHLHALAWMCREKGIPLICMVRGEENYLENPTLSDIKDWGAKFNFLSRSEYRRRYDPDFLKELKKKNPGYTYIPEGGSNALALKGVEELAQEIIDQLPQVKTIILPVGTGGTLAGLIKSLPANIKILGIGVEKENYLEKMVQAHLGRTYHHWSIVRDYHFGGFGQCPSMLLDFMRTVHSEHGLLLDPIYTGKSFFALYDLIHSGLLNESDQPILFLHTGGLQGIRGYQYLHPGSMDWATDLNADHPYTPQ